MKQNPRIDTLKEKIADLKKSNTEYRLKAFKAFASGKNQIGRNLENKISINKTKIQKLEKTIYQVARGVA